MRTDNQAAQLHPFFSISSADHPDAFDINAEFDRRSAISAEPLDLDRDQATFDQIKQRFDASIAKLDGLELAIAMVGRPKHPGASPEFYAKADPYHGIARNKSRARAAVEQIEEEIEALRPQVEIAAERARQAREQRAVEIAASYRSRHRKATRAIAAALEVLSKAVADEQQLHQEADAEMPGVGSLLPNFGGPWRSALLSNPRSVASEWVRGAQRVGFVDR
ncbi:outer membrane murein-binding lipoprotein Lpp [Bradyrhizobium sp. GM6.1]